MTPRACHRLPDFALWAVTVYPHAGNVVVRHRLPTLVHSSSLLCSQFVRHRLPTAVFSSAGAVWTLRRLWRGRGSGAGQESDVEGGDRRTAPVRVTSLVHVSLASALGRGREISAVLELCSAIRWPLRSMADLGSRGYLPVKLQGFFIGGGCAAVSIPMFIREAAVMW